MLFLSRIHPVKGLLNLVQAWPTVQPTGWQMIIAGPDEGGHQKIVEAAIRQAGLQNEFVFTGSVDGAEKTVLYRSADMRLAEPIDQHSLRLPESAAQQVLTFIQTLERSYIVSSRLPLNRSTTPRHFLPQ